jgi:RNA 3'-phosphate cyclase
MIHIDGSHNEGGGQILRTALALSVLTGKPFRAVKIRHHRPRPGLKNQHLTCIRAVEQIAKVHVRGARPGSASVDFFPEAVSPGTYSIDIGTAGSISLLLKAVLLPCMFTDGPMKLSITGGADALGERGKRAEKVGTEATGKLMRVLSSDAWSITIWRIISYRCWRS